MECEVAFLTEDLQRDGMTWHVSMCLEPCFRLKLSSGITDVGQTFPDFGQVSLH